MRKKLIHFGIYLLYLVLVCIWVDGISFPDKNCVQYFAYGRLQIVGEGPYSFVCDRIDMTFSNDVVGYKQIGHTVYVVGKDSLSVVEYAWGSLFRDEYTLLPVANDDKYNFLPIPKSLAVGWQQMKRRKERRMKVIPSFENFRREDQAVFRKIMAGTKDEHGLLTY